MKIKAAVATAANVPLQIMTVDLAPPGEGEVLVRMHAAGLCHSDLSLMEGKIGHYGFPIVPGHEGAGTVVSCGPGVTGLEPGDHVVPVAIPECRVCPNCTSGKTNACVEMRNPPSPRFALEGAPVTAFCGLGTFADHAVITESRLAKIRPDAPDHIACYIGCGVITGVGAALQTAKVGPGSSVAIVGMGGIGLSVLQGARIAGAVKIICIDLNPEREAICRDYGATHFIDARSAPDLVSAINAIVPGGVDFGFECVGHPVLMRSVLEATNPGWGMGISVGIPPSGTELVFDPSSFMMGRSWKGSVLGGEKTRTTIPRLVDWYCDGFLKLDELITHRLSLDEINRGFDYMKSGEAIRSVILFD
jgi:S-(hydroxymethyl)glutathione dehydrogenase/alcohol dehydrogenase